MTNYLSTNGETKNWVCYIRPTKLQKCLQYACVSDITYSFSRDENEFRVTLAQLL